MSVCACVRTCACVCACVRMRLYVDLQSTRFPYPTADSRHTHTVHTHPWPHPHTHAQELIIQNFVAKPGTPMGSAGAPSPPLSELQWAVAAARVMFGPDMNIQVRACLCYAWACGLLGPCVLGFQ